MILPGPIGPHTAQELTRFLELTERNKQLLDAWQDGRLDRFPARVNDYQSSTGRYSWTEQAFTAFGQRYDRPGGRTGSFTYSPAYGYGGGVVTEFPMPVWLTRRVIGVESGSGGLLSIGPVYEFPLYCGCVAGDQQSGSGAGSGGFVLAPCCPNPIPRTLFATFSSTPACVCWDSIGTLVLIWNGFGWAPTLPFDLCGTTINQFLFNCFGFGTTWGFVVSSLGTCGFISGSSVAVCNPFAVTITFTITGCAECAGSTVVVTVTE